MVTVDTTGLPPGDYRVAAHLLGDAGRTGVQSSSP